MSKVHSTVLLKETVNFLNPKSNGIYVDATLGFGGHSQELLKKIKTGKLIGFDQDDESIEFCKSKFKKNKNIYLIKSNFSNLESELKKLKISKIDGILLDLGVNYYQLTDVKRGFTYHNNSELDMRMDTSQTLTAKKIVNEYPEKKLSEIFWKYGEEKKAKQIANAICEYRKENEIVSNQDLNSIIKSIKGFDPKKHSSKNVFQALRIEVNNELEVLKQVLEQATKLLNPSGKLAVITFHSLEDKIVKEYFWKVKQIFTETEKEIKHQFSTHKVIYPSKEELTENNSSRSSKLRTITKNHD